MPYYTVVHACGHTVEYSCDLSGLAAQPCQNCRLQTDGDTQYADSGQAGDTAPKPQEVY